LNKHLEEYKALRDEIDSKCSELWSMHKSNMQCGAGCSSCCQAFKILPVEFDYINQKLKEEGIDTDKPFKKGECKYLVDNKCSIYAHRPIICRTHGYPLVRLNEEVEEYEVSYCQLNFKSFSLEKFNANNVFFEDTYNSKLFQVNKNYLDSLPNTDCEQGQLLELNDTGKSKKKQNNNS